MVEIKDYVEMWKGFYSNNKEMDEDIDEKQTKLEQKLHSELILKDEEQVYSSNDEFIDDKEILKKIKIEKELHSELIIKDEDEISEKSGSDNNEISERSDSDNDEILQEISQTTNTQKEIYSCNICNKNFTTNDSLVGHKRRSHNRSKSVRQVQTGKKLIHVIFVINHSAGNQISRNINLFIPEKNRILVMFVKNHFDVDRI